MPRSGSRPVVVFDDRCGFCRRWIRRLQAWDRAGRLAFLPLQDPGAPAVTGVPRATLEQAVHVVFPTGEVAAGGAALPALCPFLPGGRFVRLLLRVPGVMALVERGYRWVAWHWGPVGARAGDR